MADTYSKSFKYLLSPQKNRGKEISTASSNASAMCLQSSVMQTPTKIFPRYCFVLGTWSSRKSLHFCFYSSMCGTLGCWWAAWEGKREGERRRAWRFEITTSFQCTGLEDRMLICVLVKHWTERYLLHFNALDLKMEQSCINRFL